jgi:hypothetical protein
MPPDDELSVSSASREHARLTGAPHWMEHLPRCSHYVAVLFVVLWRAIAGRDLGDLGKTQGGRGRRTQTSCGRVRECPEPKQDRDCSWGLTDAITYTHPQVDQTRDCAKCHAVCWRRRFAVSSAGCRQ